MPNKHDDKCFLFDVDGTLTAPRQRMEWYHWGFFLDWIEYKNVYLVSGSDFLKIKEQVPLQVLQKCNGVFSCMGNELWEPFDTGMRTVYQNKFESIPEEVKEWLQFKLGECYE